MIKTNDKFYTKPRVVDRCLKSINFENYDLAIEPSAGNGAFFKKISCTKKIGFDIDPECENVINQNFFGYTPHNNEASIIIVGNPPFGKNSSLAVKFFNFAATFADTIAFILPKTFRKISFQNKINPLFYLIHDEDLPKNSFFLPDGTECSIPSCCWMIWNKNTNIPPRAKIKAILNHDDFDFVTNKCDADFMFQRVGVRAGLCHKDFNTPLSSHYLIKAYVDGVFEKMMNLDWNSSSKYYTAGNPSISKHELIQKYDEVI